jgi:uncharacterized protein
MQTGIASSKRKCIVLFLFLLSVSLSASDLPDLSFILSHNRLSDSGKAAPQKGAELRSTNELTMAGMLLIRLYQVCLSPQTPPSCNFYPSCSQYGLLAVKKYGFFLGVLMASDRLQRCHGKGLGHYPVHRETGKRYDPL